MTDGENATVLGPSHGFVVKGATLTGISVELCPNSNRFWCPESRFADTVTRRSRKSHRVRIRARSSSCATLALVQTDSEPDPPCLHAANKRSSRSGGRCCAATAQVKTRSPLSKPHVPFLREQTLVAPRQAHCFGTSPEPETQTSTARTARQATKFRNSRSSVLA